MIYGVFYGVKGLKITKFPEIFCEKTSLALRHSRRTCSGINFIF